jgi:dTDP-4-amino-4,6-dideoxy-D-galactose acyltransferase
MWDIQYLEWDSNFFGRKIGKYEIHSNEDTNLPPELLSEAQQNSYALIYIFSPQPLSSALIAGFDIKLTDIKTLYRQDLNGISVPDRSPHVLSVQPSDSLAPLYELAYESGQYSRYKLDEHFSESEFRDMYRIWVDNSIRGSMADTVYVFKTGNDTAAMVTLKIEHKKGIIGLLATAPEHRGKGIGNALINQVRNDLLEKGIMNLEVATQAANQRACRFYEKAGFMPDSRLMMIYHVWL